jgi:hypothetical protein
MIVHDAISDDERAIILAFARNMRQGGSGMLTIATLLGDEPKRRHDLQLAIWQLADRGWLVVNSPLHWENHHECMLLGEGLRLAKQMGADQSR